MLLVLVDKENLYKEMDDVHIDVNGLPKTLLNRLLSSRQKLLVLVLVLSVCC